MAGEEFKVRVGVELDDASFNSLKNQINSVAQKEPIKVKVDTKEAENSVKSLKTQIESLGKTNISLSGATKIESALNDISSSVKEIKTSLSSLNSVTVKPKIDVGDVDKKVSNVKSKINTLDDMQPIDIRADTSNVDSAISSITKKITVTAKNVEELKTRLNNFGLDGSSIDKFVNGIDKAVVSVDKIKVEMDGDNSFKITVTGEDELHQATTVVRKFKQELDDAGKATGNWNVTEKIASTDNLKKLRAEIEGISNAFKGGKLDYEIKKIETEFDKLGIEGSNSLNEMETALNNFESAYNKLSDDPASMERLINSYKELTAAMSKASYEAKGLKLTSVDEVTRSTDVAKLKKWMNDNTKAAREYGAELNSILEKLSQCNNSVERSQLLNKSENIKATAALENKTGLTIGDTIKKKFKEYGAYFSVASLAIEATQGLRNMYQAVLEVDTAMTELKRVTDLSANQYTDLYGELTVSAREYGTTLADIINATADWSRAGFDANTAKGLAEVTTMYEHIADVDYDTAVQNLLTAYKGFQGQLDEQFGTDTVAAVSYIGDILNELDNEYAVTAGGIGEALKRSASALDIAGNSIQETAAMVTGITEVTQDPEKAGNALKVLSMRLRGMKGGLEELGEEVDDNVTNLSKMQGQVLNLTHGKVDIFDSAGEFKSTYEIMQGIADVWEDLSSIEQADLLETIAGKHRANDVAALIQNWNDVEKAVVSATDAEGSAAREHEKYMDSIQGKLNALTSVFQTFSNTVMSSDLIKFAVDALKSLLDIIEKIISTIGGIGTAGIFTGIGLVIRNIVKGGNIATFFQAIKGGINSLKDFGAAAKIAGEGIKAFLSTPAGIATGIGAIVTVIAGVYSAIQSINEANRKARQEVIDTSNTFSDAYNGFEQLYIQYSGKNVLSVDEENELKNAIDGTVSALGDKSAAFRDAIGASSDYVNNLDKVADAELKQAQQLAQDAKVKAKEQLTDWWSGDAGQYQLFSWKDSKADFKLPGKSNKNYKVVEDIVNDPNFQKWLSKQHTRKAYIGPGDDDYIAQFDRNANFDELVEYYNYARKTKQAFADMAKETGDDSYLEDESYKSAAEAVESMSSGMETLVQQTYNEAKAGYQLQNGIATTEKDFFKMRESILSSTADTVEARDMIGDVLNKEYSDIFDLSSVESQIDYIKSVTKGIKDIDIGNDKLNTFETFLDLKTSLNNGECTVGEYIAQMDKVNEVINGIEDKATQDFLRVQLGLELDVDGNIDDKIKKWRDNLVDNMTRSGVEKDIANKLADGLNAQELEAAVDFVAEEKIDLKNVDIDDFKKQIEQRAELNKALRFSVDTETETQGIEAFNTALSETRSATGLTSDSMEKLRSRYNGIKGYDAAKLFEETATGVRLNTEEVNKLEQAYANANIKDIDNNLKVLKDEYDKLGVKIQNYSDINERAELYAEREDVRAKINELAELGAAYEGLTNVYAQWQNAESAGNNRDMYANVQSAMETVKEELDLGWVDDGTKEYFDLIWGDNWNSAGKGIEDYRAKWATLDDTIDGTTYSIQDFFKVDKDGNLKASGINNFFDAVRQKQEELGKNWVEFDKDGNLTTIDLGVNGEQAIADALGISEELVDIFMQASKDAGFVVTIDGKYTKLADLQNRAEEAAKTLKDMGKTDFDFDFDTTSLKSVNEQLEEAESILDKFKKDGKIKKEFINADGSFTEDAQAAIDVMSTLTAMADQLSEPTYMKLETNQVKKELQEPLKDMQRFEDLVKKKHQLEITGADTSEVDKEMDEIAKRIEGDDDLRATLGIDSDASLEDIKKQLEAGELEIPATVDIQMEMSDDLKDIRMLLMHQAGMLSDEDLSLAFDLDLDTSEIDNYKPEQKKAIVDFFADTKDVDNYTPEQKKAIAKYIKDISDIDSYSPEDKQAVCDFIVNNEDVMGYTPDEKVAIAKYMADPSSLDSFTPEDKKAVAKFIAEHGEVDAWNPANRQAIATFLLNNALVEGYQPSDKDLKVIAQVDKSNVNNYQPADKTMTVWATIKKRASSLWNSITGGSIADGTANSNGTAYVNGTTGKAFKHGNWGTANSGTALVGELGQELLVRDGQYYTIGDNGAEFIDYKKGDIIFNAGQTRQLFEQGKIVNGQTRGRAYVDGNVLNNPSLVNLLGITPFTGVFNLDVSPINEDAISTLEEYNTLLENAIELGYDLKAQTVFGNIDTNNRQLLTWTDENINMYHDALKSWDYSDEDIVNMKGDVSTVMGAWGNFGENGEYEIAFSPMLQTDDGAVLLSADAVNDYIEGLIAEASEDGVVTAGELFELDAKGDGNISNLIAAVGSSADVVSQLMHYVGKDGAIAMSINADGAKEAASDVNDLNNAVSETKNYTGEKFAVGVDDYGIQDAIEWMDELNGYIEESASSTGLAAESMEALTNRYKDLDGFDVASLFQESATGIQLNTDAVKKYEQQMAKDRSDKINKALKSLRREYYANAKAIKTCTDAGKKQQLIDRNAAIREEIKSIDALSAAYDGATSKYNQWAEASSKSKQREPYDNINNEFDNVLDLLDRGWLGDEEVTSFLDLVYGDNYDTAGKTADEVAADLRNKMSQVIDGTSYSIGDFFTYDDNGKMTADGYFNMLDAIMQKQQELGENWVQMDENGNYTFDFGVNGLDEIAEAFGISKDLLALILQAGRDAGHEVNFGGVIENIDALEQKATGAVDKLHEIGATDYQFNLNTGDVDSLTEQLDVANGVLDQFRNEDGTINMDMDGAQEAIALVQYLQAQIDLVNSHYINIETDDESLQEPLEKLQDYEILAAELNSLNIDPQVNADEITTVEQQMQEIVDYIAGLDSETLAKLGFNFDGLTTEEIQQQITDAIKNGTVTIPIKPKVESTDEAGGSNTSEVNTTVNVDTNDPDGSLKFLDEYAEKYGERGITLKAQLSAEDVDPEVIDDCRWLVDTFGDAGLDLALALTDGTNGQNFSAIMGIVQTYGDKGLNLALALTDGTNGQHFGELMGLVNTYGDKGLDIALALTDGQNEQHYGEIMGLINTYGDAGLDVALALTDGVNEENYGKIMGLINDYGDRAFQFAIAITNDEEGTNTNLLDEIIQLSEEHGGEALDIGYALTDKTDAEQTEWLEFIKSHPNDFEVTYRAIVEGDTVLLKKILGEDGSGTALEVSGDQKEAVVQDGQQSGTAVGTSRVHPDNNGSYTYNPPDTYTGASLSGANGPSLFDLSGYLFGVRQAQAQEAPQDNEGKVPVKGELEGIDASNVVEAEVPVEGELKDTDTTNAPEEQINVEGKMNEVDDSVLNNPFQVAVDDSGIKDALQDGETLKSTLLGLSDSDVLAIGNMMLPGLSEAVTDANQMRDIISGISPDGLVNIFTNTGIESALADAETFNAYLDTLTSEQRQVVLDLVTPEDPEEQTVNAEIQADDSDVVEKTSEQRIVPATIDLNTAVMESYLGATKHSTVALDPYLIKKSFTGTIALTATSVSGTGNVKVNGTSNANGTAYVNGTTGKAFKHGNWGTKESGTALVGELGQEMVVRDGHFFTVGDNGAEFFNYKKGDIVFNAGQTKQLFEQGKIINGQARGRAYANGTAFGVGTASGSGGRRPKTTTSGSRGNYTGSGGGSYSSSGGDSDASDEADEFEETLDWIETKIDRIERAISKLDTTASSVYKNWGTRNEALVNQISKVGEEINLQQQAYDRYLAQANSVGLSEDYVEKIKNGTIDIETITDEDLNDKISEYKEWYEKALDCKDAIDDLKETEAELYKQRFDNVETKFSGILGVIEHEKNILNEFIDRSETKGWLVSTEYYKALGENEQKNIAELEKQRDEQIAALNEAVDSGKIEKYSEAWYECVSSIDETTESIEEGKTALEDYKKSIRELEWKQFDLLQDKISRITSESEFLIDLMSSDELYDDKGQLTDSGMATMGLHGMNYNVEMAQADKAGEEAAKIKKELEKDPFNQDLLDRYNDLIDSQQEHIKNAQSEKEAIKDLVSDGINKELDALQDLIDKRNEALDSEKDLYDYQKKVKEQTEDIAKLEKQMSAYSGDDSEETMQKVQQIKVDLESAKEDLEETEYDKYIDDTQKMLDDLYDSYEEILNERLDNLDLLVSDMTDSINANGTSISKTISDKAESVGCTLSDSMGRIWNTNDLATNTNGVKNVITTYGDKFSTALTTTNTALGNISTDVASMISQLNKLAKTNIKSASTSSAATQKPASKPTPKPTPAPTPSTSKGDGVPKIGDKVKFTGGWYYYDSQGTPPAGHQHQGEEVYITNINTRDWATHGYHISTGKTLGNGDLGWLKLNQLSGYASGKKKLLGSEAAWTQENGQEFIVRPSDGAILTPLTKGDSVLTAAASSNIWDMANNPADFIRNNLNLDNVGTSANHGNQTNVIQNIDNVVFSMPNVKNYNEMLTTMQNDRNFERLINAMTIDRLNGKSSLAKGKAIR